MNEDAVIVETTFLTVIDAILKVLGCEEIGREPIVDLDKLPATVVRAGHIAAKYLMVAAGMLDEDAKPATDMTADEFLARLTKDAS